MCMTAQVGEGLNTVLAVGEMLTWKQMQLKQIVCCDQSKLHSSKENDAAVVQCNISIRNGRKNGWSTNNCVKYI